MGAEGGEAASERIIRQADDSLRYLNWSLFLLFFFFCSTWKATGIRLTGSACRFGSNGEAITGGKGLRSAVQLLQAYMDICACPLFQRKN